MRNKECMRGEAACGRYGNIISQDFREGRGEYERF